MKPEIQVHLRQPCTRCFGSGQEGVGLCRKCWGGRHIEFWGSVMVFWDPMQVADAPLLMERKEPT